MKSGAKLRFPLYAQLLLWLALNLLLIVSLFIALPGRNGSGWAMLLSEPVRARLLSIGALPFDGMDAALTILAID